MRFSCLLLLPGRIYGRHSSSFVPFMDRHNCLHFDLSTVVPTQKNCENVQSRILEQLSAVCNEVPPRCNAVWVHLLSSQCSLLPRLCAPPPDGQGFQLHHAKPKSLSLYRWLGPGDDRVPAFTTHQVAITAVISRTHDGHVLMVQENTPRLVCTFTFDAYFCRLDFGSFPRAEPSSVKASLMQPYARFMRKRAYNLPFEP
uniref:Nucleoside diphosphate-linked moiety X motif 6 n=2 Tax=Schistocephalus solidus TaxID=70667 RepID=A0A0V0J5F7_SCHSO